MFRAMFRSLLCRKGGCCLWLFLRRRQPLYEDDDAEFLVDPDMNICGMSRVFVSCLPAEVPTDTSAKIAADIDRLAADEKSTSRLLACKLLCTNYGLSTPRVKDHLGEVFERLCTDEDMFVRRMALSTLTEFAKEADVKFYASHFVPVLENLLDDKIGFRLEAAKVLVSLFQSQQLSDNIYLQLLPVFLKYAEDPYWQVRFIIANSILDVQLSANSIVLNSSLMGLIKKLSMDAEPRVRLAVHRQILAR